MKKLLGSKYNNALELIEETGKIPMMCIDDGDLEALTNEIEELGYKCKLDSSTDYLLVFQLTRSEMIENLKGIGTITLNSKELQDVMPLAYDFLKEKFEGFAADPNNTATKEELQDFQNGKFLVEILFKEDEVVYFVGADAQQLSNDPNWGEDDWNDIETETLKELLEVAK